MKNKFLTFFILTVTASCSQPKQKMAFNPIIASGKSLNYSVNSGQFYAVTPKSGFAGDATALMSLVVLGTSEFDSSADENDPYGYDMEAIGNDLTTQIAAEEGKVIMDKYNLSDPAYGIADTAAQEFAHKYDMKLGHKIELKTDKKGYLVKDENVASANYLLNVSSQWQIKNRPLYGQKYEFIYRAYLSLNDVSAFAAPQKLESKVLVDECEYVEKEKFTYDDYVANNAAKLKGYVEHAKIYCTNYFTKRIRAGDIGAKYQRVD